MKPSQRASCSQPPPCVTEPAASRTSSKGLRSSFGLLDEERAHGGGPPEHANTADPLSRKSSEGLRWISKPLGNEKRELIRSARAPGDKETETAEEEEQAARSNPTDQSQDDDNHLQPMVAMSALPTRAVTGSSIRADSAGLEQPVTDRGRSSLPSAPPSLVGRQCVMVVCFSACMLFLLCTVAVVMAYSRWVATSTLTTPTSNGDPGSGQQNVDGRSGCDSLFSFSHCADSDMFG